MIPFYWIGFLRILFDREHDWEFVLRIYCVLAAGTLNIKRKYRQIAKETLVQC